jgi:hypothetical protein
MKLKLTIYVLVAAIAFLGTLLALMAITDGRADPTHWPLICDADAACAYVTATPRPTWLPATGTAWADYQLAVYATNEVSTAAAQPAD